MESEPMESEQKAFIPKQNEETVSLFKDKKSESVVSESTLPYCKNSVLAFLLLGLVIFNLVFTFRNILFNSQWTSKTKLCPKLGIQVPDDFHSDIINVVFFGKYAYKNMKIIRGVNRTVSSILEYTQSPIHFHILLDLPSKERMIRVFKKISQQYHRKINVTYYDVDWVSTNFKTMIQTMKNLFFNKDVGRYNDDIFFMSEIFHLVFPKYLSKIIFLDLDLQFVADIKELYAEFTKFSSSNLIGIGPDLQPQYREDFAEFRKLNPDTSVGAARPGKQGFNTGVTLFHLEKLRESALYESLLNSSVLEKLCHKYQFKGYLGHQDFYTLTGMEFPELYYNLDCSWNRQLDTGWLQSIDKETFDNYHSCNKTKIFHANGDARIPQN